MKHCFSDKRLHKLDFYLRASWRNLWAKQRCGRRLDQAVASYHGASADEREYVQQRVSYYNRISLPFSAQTAACSAESYTRGKSWAYHLDFNPLIACFPRESRFDYLFGDVTHIPERPTFVKSRPVRGGDSNGNSILLKLNQIRHYHLPTDPLSHEEKDPKAVWRGSAHLENRKHFLECCYGKGHCDIGDVSKKSLGKPWHREFMSIREQLRHRFVISVEGNDVATNIKWIMASNSLCMMTRPGYETWFMEGSLIPGHHYVELRDDYADLEEKIAYYTAYPEAAKAIVRNANAHVRQFLDEEREFLISLLVMDKYFRMSGQPSIAALGQEIVRPQRAVEEESDV